MTGDELDDSGELDALLHLQEADTTIRRIEKRLDELPEQAALDEVLERAEKVRSARDSGKVDLERIDAEIRSFEGNLEMLQERHANEQTRMYSGEISNPKELQAIRAEIDSVTKRIEEREEELLEAMERREELSDRLADLEQGAAQLDEEQEQLEAARDEAAQGLLAELGEAKASRDEERARISDELLERYERSRERHAGVGVGKLESGICTACRLQLTPLERSQLREGDGLGTCPQCQRLIVAV